MHVASSFEFVMAPAMFQNARERLRGTARRKLVRGRTINWIGAALELSSDAQKVFALRLCWNGRQGSLAFRMSDT